MEETKCSLKSHQVIGAQVYKRNRPFVPIETFVKIKKEQLIATLEREYEMTRQNLGCCGGCRISS